MNLFELFGQITHMHIPYLWQEATATFTENRRKAAIMRRRRMIEADYDAYEISYFAGKKLIKSRHSFHPLPAPYPESLKGTSLRILYKKQNPKKFILLPTGEKNERDRL